MLPLADFNTAYYDNQYTTVATTCYANNIPIGAFPSTAIQTITMANEMTYRGHTTFIPKATPSPLTMDASKNLDSFSIKWNSAGSSVGLFG